MPQPRPADNPLASDMAGGLVRALRARLDTPGMSAADEAGVRLDLARALFAQTRYAEAIIEGGGLLQRPEVPAGVRVRAMGVLAGAFALGGRADDARRVAEQALASPDADQETRVLARSALRGLHFLDGRYETAVEDARAVVALARGGGPIARAEASLDMGGMLSHVDAFDEAAAWLALDEDAPAQQRREADELLATMDLAAGRWSSVLDRLDPPRDHDFDADRSEASVTRRRGLRAAAWLHLDRLEHARRELRLGPGASRAHPTALVVSALVSEAEGDVRVAGSLLERVVAHDDERRYPPLLRVWGPTIVRVSIHAGDPAIAERATRALERAAKETHVPSVHGAAAASRGQVERDPAMLRTAVLAFAAGPRAVAHAQALEALGEASSVHGDLDRAVAAYRDAHDAFRRLGAERDARRVARRLSERGVRTGRTPAASRGRLGWDALTPTEATVAALVAEGLTNARIADRLLVSRRTVETHVAHVLTKLDVPTRSSIARVAMAREPSSSPPDR